MKKPPLLAVPTCVLCYRHNSFLTDQDGLVNGVIIDPARPAVLGSPNIPNNPSANPSSNGGARSSNAQATGNAGVPNTGFTQQMSLPYIASGIAGLCLLGYGYSRRKRL